MSEPYVDVRPPWPTLIQGQAAVTIKGAKRDITVAEAIEQIIGEDRSQVITTDINLPIATE